MKRMGGLGVGRTDAAANKIKNNFKAHESGPRQQIKIGAIDTHLKPVKETGAACELLGALAGTESSKSKVGLLRVLFFVAGACTTMQ